MKLRNWKQFILKESFGLSPEMYKFIQSKSIDWSEFTDSLIPVTDIKEATVKKYTHIVDQNGHIINVELEEDKEYRLNYGISITHLSSKSGSIEQFNKILESLNTITISIQEMIDRVKSSGLKINKNTFKTDIIEWTGTTEIQHRFEIEFLSDLIDMKELKKFYDEYLEKNKFTPEFNKGIKELTERYKRENINLMQFLDTATPDEFDTIMVGFITEDDIYGIADYNIKTKKFTIDEAEVEASIDWYREEYGFD